MTARYLGLDYLNRRKDFEEVFLDHLASWEFAASQPDDADRANGSETAPPEGAKERNARK
jgi:hypothetical protein